MKNICEVKSDDAVRTRKWMCTARPEYQPGYFVTKVTLPSASVVWKPRSQCWPVVAFWETSEYLPCGVGVPDVDLCADDGRAVVGGVEEVHRDGEVDARL